MTGPGILYMFPLDSNQPDSVQTDQGECLLSNSNSSILPSMPWWPLLLQSLVQIPIFLLHSQTLLINPLGDRHPLAKHQQMNLLACVISGDCSKTETLRRVLSRSSSALGVSQRGSRTSLHGTLGHAGAYRSQLIPWTRLRITC